MSRTARNTAAAVAVEAALVAGSVLGPVMKGPPPSPASSACPAGEHLAQDGAGLPECER